MAIEALRDSVWTLLPGTLCTAAVFAPFLDALGVPSGHRRPLVLDRPSVREYRSDLVQAPGGSVICGFSLGAILAAHHADRVTAARMILFGLNPLADDPAKADDRRALARDVGALGGAAALASRLPPLGGPDPDAARRTILAMASDAAADIEAQTTLALTRPGALRALSRARPAILTLNGDMDRMAPAAQGRAAAEAAPRGRFGLLAGLGHYALVENPAACAKAVLALEESLP